MSVYSTPTGWRYDFTLNGKRYTQSGIKTKQEAKEREVDKRREIELGEKQISTPTDMDLKTLLNRRLDYLKDYRSERYYTDQKYQAKRWLQAFGSDTLVSEMTADVIQGFLVRRKREVSPYTANKELRMAKALFNFGKKKGWIDRNPTDGLEFFPEDRKLKYVPPLEDIDKVIAAADPEDQDYLIVIRDTMARVNEINALTWQDVDLENRRVTLYTRKKRGGHRTPRKVPMTEQVYGILSRMAAERDLSKPWVFWHKYYSRKTGEMVEGPYTYRGNLMKGLCKKAEVKKFGFHALRHLGASLLERERVPTVTIQRILGHENRTTTEIYLQSLGDAEREAMVVLDRTWAKKPASEEQSAA